MPLDKAVYFTHLVLIPPPGAPYVDTVLEEPPKWGLLKDVLEEVGTLKEAHTAACKAEAAEAEGRVSGCIFPFV